jgi:hypothetical protein
MQAVDTSQAFLKRRVTVQDMARLPADILLFIVEIYITNNKAIQISSEVNAEV